MTVMGHIAASYLVSQSVRLVGLHITPQESALVIIAGTILDLDALPLWLKGRIGMQHHALPTHTPLAIFAGWTIFKLITGRMFPTPVHVLMIVSGLLHLAMDDSGYWLAKKRLQRNTPVPQITWMYPFRNTMIDRFAKDGAVSAAVEYVRGAKVSIVLEASIVLTAIWVMMRLR
ncbi:hypothetical protein A2Z33_00170 [Candidatus Gottesmanbacteria bacterium RBG_16_52_11]|uniref:Metal-dependent hydrolase n=1 Tax=Candidatus Gottesmanbacteria bacterium RBG_16_52_11 TaxID=1798374 RepID=A0A1F5YNG6_9BACT|nr:MAG: hypothetical protein A2Z33_00170 [Candidatus Gottesmanbacteria bacterium RBG_16_52_11]